ncbi:hypothetical protein ATG_13350 [Desulfurococcaceae archaeon AG1]|jgi:HEPN domain-containing protein|nr:hypothetical protein ATG_13350 [Desulfurococcaceae archaeon AG1]
MQRLGRYSKACFFSHQAAEKALKALMIKRLGIYDPIHSVAELLRRLSRSIEIEEGLIEKGELLDRFYIPTRYPNAWPWGAPHKHYTKEDAEKALLYADEVLRFVKREVERDP